MMERPWLDMAAEYERDDHADLEGDPLTEEEAEALWQEAERAWAEGVPAGPDWEEGATVVVNGVLLPAPDFEEAGW